MSNNSISYHRLEALAQEVEKIDARLALYKTADEQNSPSIQLMIRQYTRLRCERYTDYLQELLAMKSHSKSLLPILQELTARIFIDTDEEAPIEVRKTLEMLMRASKN